MGHPWRISTGFAEPGTSHRYRDDRPATTSGGSPALAEIISVFSTADPLPPKAVRVCAGTPAASPTGRAEYVTVTPSAMPTGTTGRAGWGCAAAPATALRRRYRHGPSTLPGAAHHGRHRAPRRRHRTPPRRATLAQDERIALTLNRRRVPGNTNPVTSRSTRASSSTARGAIGERYAMLALGLHALARHGPTRAHQRRSPSTSPTGPHPTGPRSTSETRRPAAYSCRSRTTGPPPGCRRPRHTAARDGGAGRRCRCCGEVPRSGSPPAGLSSRWPSAIAHFMTVPIRCRTRAARFRLASARSARARP